MLRGELADPLARQLNERVDCSYIPEGIEGKVCSAKGVECVTLGLLSWLEFRETASERCFWNLNVPPKILHTLVGLYIPPAADEYLKSPRRWFVVVMSKGAQGRRQQATRRNRRSRRRQCRREAQIGRTWFGRPQKGSRCAAC